jgi:hypothetical protein
MHIEVELGRGGRGQAPHTTRAQPQVPHGISFILCMLGVRMLRDVIFWKNINIYFKLKLDLKSLNYIELIRFYFILLN